MQVTEVHYIHGGDSLITVILTVIITCKQGTLQHVAQVTHSLNQ